MDGVDCFSSGPLLMTWVLIWLGLVLKISKLTLSMQFSLSVPFGGLGQDLSAKGSQYLLQGW